MSMREVILGGAALVVLASSAAWAADSKIETPHLGVPVTQADIAAWDIAIGPSGVGLPPGGATAKQGAVIFNEKCASCHGLNGEGKPADQLVGGQGSLPTKAAVKTVGSYWPYATTLFDFIRRAMPLNEPQSLTTAEVYALTAHILHLNGIIGENDNINAKSLPEIKMPNHDAFFAVYPGNLK